MKSRLFSDKRKANVLWHDLKRDFVIFEQYIENITDKVYGPLPKGLRTPLKDLRAVTLRGRLRLENLMFIDHLDKHDLVLRKTTVPLATLCKGAYQFNSVPKTTIASTLQTRTDQRYGTLLLANAIFSLQQLSVKHTLTITPGPRQIVVTFRGPTAKNVRAVPMKKLVGLLYAEEAPVTTDIVLALNTLMLLGKKLRHPVAIHIGTHAQIKITLPTA